MKQEYNPYAKHMKSSKKRFVATTPEGKEYQADTQEEMTKLLKNNGLIKPKPNVEDKPSIEDPKVKTVKPQYDPDTGERIN